MGCKNCGEQYPCYFCGNLVSLGDGMFSMVHEMRRWVCVKCLQTRLQNSKG